jgi:hypothetical protein
MRDYTEWSASLPAGQGGADGQTWVIAEGITFVESFDEHHRALIMTALPYEAKFFSSPQEAALWVLQYGKDLDVTISYILPVEHFLRSTFRY